jgi:hypothetical protein
VEQAGDAAVRLHIARDAAAVETNSPRLPQHTQTGCHISSSRAWQDGWRRHGNAVYPKDSPANRTSATMTDLMSGVPLK